MPRKSVCEEESEEDLGWEKKERERERERKKEREWLISLFSKVSVIFLGRCKYLSLSLDSVMTCKTRAFV